MDPNSTPNKIIGIPNLLPRFAAGTKVSVAKTQEKVNKYADAADKYAGTLGAFERMEEKADKMLNKATAMDELNKRALAYKESKSNYEILDLPEEEPTGVIADYSGNIEDYS